MEKESCYGISSNLGHSVLVTPLLPASTDTQPGRTSGLCAAAAPAVCHLFFKTVFEIMPQGWLMAKFNSFVYFYSYLDHGGMALMAYHLSVIFLKLSFFLLSFTTIS